jgi:hypothetical protein
MAPRKLLRVSTPCYLRTDGRHQHLVLGEKPDLLLHLDQVDSKAWKGYQTHLARVNPIERAEFYARQMEARRLQSRHALERALKVPINSVSRALRLLGLPDPLRRHLKDQSTPENLAYFTEQRLLDLLQVGDPRRIWKRFQEMLSEAERLAPGWMRP